MVTDVTAADILERPETALAAVVSRAPASWEQAWDRLIPPGPTGMDSLPVKTP